MLNGRKKGESKPEALNGKRLKFCLEYAKTFHGTNSAIAAGYSENSAHDAANRLLKDTQVRDKILELLGVNATAVQSRIAAIALTSFTDIMTWDEGGVRLKKPHEISSFHKMAIKRIRVVETPDGITTDVELHDPFPALNKLSKLTGLEDSDSKLPLLQAINTLVDEGIAPVSMIEILKKGLTKLQEDLKEAAIASTSADLN